MKAAPFLLAMGLLINASASVASPQVIAHRGASAFAPENTLEAFRKAVELGADFVEVDVRSTSDGELVILHDATLDRTTPGRGRVNEYTLAQVRSLGAGVPTLEEALLELKEKSVKLIIELKDGNEQAPGIEERTISLLRKHEMFSRVVLKSFDHRSLARLRLLAPEVPQVFVFVLAWPSLSFMISNRPEWINVLGLPAEYLQMHICFLTRAFVRKAHAKGFKVIAWGVDSPASLKKAREAGVDAVETDDPTLKFSSPP